MDETPKWDPFAAAKTLLARNCRHDTRRVTRLESIADLTGDRLATAGVSPPLRSEGVTAQRCDRCGAVFIDGLAPDAAAALSRALAQLLERSSQSYLELSVGQPPPARAETAKAPEGRAGQPAREPGEEDFADRIASPRHTLKDVILPAVTENAVLEALEKIRCHRTIYEEWGFEQVDPVGRSVSLNFYGPSGTGKSRTAEAIAAELGRPILRATAADVESRYLGASPRNVRAIFQAARESSAVLFFDEADALFGRRASEVTQGVDHEVNAVKTTLLTEMDAFEGVVILATNLEEVLDRAFIRRIQWHVEFTRPDADARARLWDLHLVSGIPLAEPRESLIEHLVVKSVDLSGGDILSILRRALPGAVRRAGDPRVASLCREDLEGAIEQIRAGYRNVGVARSSWRPAERVPAPVQAPDGTSASGAEPRVSNSNPVEKGEA